ncbi:MAG: TadE/TadG family type IV pilus assembly protein [Sphingomicrobium sp.]
MTSRRLLTDCSGSGAAEFSLVLPLLLMMLFGIIDGGRFIWEYNRAEKATQAGARMAVVTDVVSTGLATQEYVGTNGLTQGDLIPITALSPVVCSRSACTCTGSCPTNFATANTASFNAILARMQGLKPDLLAANVQVEYRGSGLGYAGDPNGMQISPLVTVRITQLTFTPLTSLLLATITMPDFRTTLTAEDSAGTQSN